MGPFFLTLKGSMLYLNFSARQALSNVYTTPWPMEDILHWETPLLMRVIPLRVTTWPGSFDTVLQSRRII